MGERERAARGGIRRVSGVIDRHDHVIGVVTAIEKKADQGAEIASGAERLGIVNGVFPAADFEREVMDRARRLAHGPSIAYRYMKENLNRAVSGELGECMDLEVTHHVHTGLTQDHREAAQAFTDKREPRFHGR